MLFFFKPVANCGISDEQHETNNGRINSLVYIVASKARHHPPIFELFGSAAAGFGVLTGDASNPNDWQASTPDQDEGKAKNQTNFSRNIFLS